MATHLNYYIDVPDEDGESVYDAIVKSIPKPLSPIPSGSQFTRVEVTMNAGLPEQHGDERLIPSSPLD